jgi:hypothetical protein
MQRHISMTSSSKFIVHKAVPKPNDTHQYELIKASTYDLSLSQVLGLCLSGISIIIQIIDINRTNDDFPLTTIDDFFQYVQALKEKTTK